VAGWSWRNGLLCVGLVLVVMGGFALFNFQTASLIWLGGLICFLIATGKVFSPQYLIWLIPLLACIAARRQTSRLWLLAWAAISLLTTFIYLVYHSQMPNPQVALRIVQDLPGFFELVALRNLLLLATVLASICGWWGAHRTPV
jgi:hypothetical protein